MDSQIIQVKIATKELRPKVGSDLIRRRFEVV